MFYIIILYVFDAVPINSFDFYYFVVCMSSIVLELFKYNDYLYSIIDEGFNTDAEYLYNFH